MYVCMYVCMYVRMYLGMYVFRYVHVYVWLRSGRTVTLTPTTGLDEEMGALKPQGSKLSLSMAYCTQNGPKVL